MERITESEFVNIAMVQIECHPSFQIGLDDYVAEPNGNKPILSRLARNNYPVSVLQRYCRDNYLVWHRARVNSIVNWFKNLHDDTFPDVVIFPEGSIPREFLECLHRHLRKKDLSPIIFAGTHAFVDTPESRRDYCNLVIDVKDRQHLSLISKLDPRFFQRGDEKKIEYLRGFVPYFNNRMLENDKKTISRDELEKLTGDERSERLKEIEKSLSALRAVHQKIKKVNRSIMDIASLEIETISVMPVLLPDGGVELIPKRFLSPFERTSVGTTRISNCRSLVAGSALKLLEVPHPREPKKIVKILPFICSDALQFTGTENVGGADLVAILSHESKPSRFGYIKELFQRNQIPVCYVNDGRYGGTSIATSLDTRGENWFAGIPHEGALPTSDGILIERILLGRSATGVGVNNPTHARSTLKLAPILCANTRLSTYKVGKLLDQTLDRILRSVDSGVPIEPQLIATRLLEIDDTKSASPIQGLCLSRLSGLALIDKLPLFEWLTFGTNCFVTQKEMEKSYAVLSGSRSGVESKPGGKPTPKKGNRHQIRKVISPSQLDEEIRDTGYITPPESLGMLEKRLTKECLAQIALLIDSQQRSDLELLWEARRDLRTLLGDESALTPVRAVERVIRRTSEEALEFAEQNLSNLLGRILEKENASSGMIFVATQAKLSDTRSQGHHSEEDGGHLRARIMSNVPFADLERGIGETNKGIVGRVAAQKRAYVSNCVVDDALTTDPYLDEHYKASIRNTRSEVAVPIFAPNSETALDELIGVLNLESREKGQFNPVEIARIQSEAAKMALDIRILQWGEDPHTTIIWHPVKHGWGLKPILDHLCHQVSRSHPFSKKYPGVSCTIWYADREKNRLYVRGTTKYDFEYLNRSYLEWNDSFLGQFIDSAQYRQVERGLPEDLPHYRRLQKAKLLDLDEIAVTPLYSRTSDTFLEGAGSDMETVGVLAIYSFRHEEAGGITSFRETFQEGIIQRLAAQFEKVIADIGALRILTANALMKSEIVSEAAIYEDKFHKIRDVLKRTLVADGTTVFGRIEQKLFPLATTGLDYAPTRQRFYEIPHGTIEQGLTLKTFELSGEPLRKNDAVDPREPCNHKIDEEPFHVIPANFLREKGAVSMSEHRRFLGCAVRGQREPVGLLRVVRSEAKMPFIRDDEKLVKLLSMVVAPCFESQYRTAFIGFDQQKAAWERKTDLLQNFAILGKNWNRRWIESFLQDLLEVIRVDDYRLQSITPVFAHLRSVIDEPGSMPDLKMVSYHSVY